MRLSNDAWRSAALLINPSAPHLSRSDPDEFRKRPAHMSRMLVKLLPKSAALDAAVQADEQPGAVLHSERIEERAYAIEAGVDTTTGEVYGELEP